MQLIREDTDNENTFQQLMFDNVETSSSVLVDECEQVEVTMTVTRVMMSGVSAGLVSLSLIIVTSLTRRIITRVSTQQHKEPQVH